MLKNMLLSATILLGASVSAQAACDFANTTPIKVQAPSFPAWIAVSDYMKTCGNVQVELDMQYKEKQPAALSAKPALYQFAGLAVNSLVPLLNDGTVRPLDDLIAKYGQNLQANQLIRIDGKVMAIAMMVNVQHLMYRRDIFADLKLPEPTNYDELLVSLAAIKKSGAMQYPMGGTYKSGWDLATDFVNMYFGFEGAFFGAGNVATVQGEAGLKTLAMMKALTAYMDPEFLTSETTTVQQQFQRGKIAAANLWVTRAAAMDDAKESTVVGKIAFAKAPAAHAGGKPATTVWWDGFAIAKNISDAEADAAFRVAMQGLSPEMVKANNNAAIWLIKGYEPGKYAVGAAASAAAGAPPYPATTAMGLMHTALGANLANFFNGRETADQTLAKIAAAYTVSAKEKGILK